MILPKEIIRTRTNIDINISAENVKLIPANLFTINEISYTLSTVKK